MTIKAIQTRYAGCHFRSRLEARWAVFFDSLGIEWEYEPQGFFISGRPYLPDFWLPKIGRWVEVKGSEESLDLELLIAASTPGGEGLPMNPEGDPYDDDTRNGPKLLILGPIPRVSLTWDMTAVATPHALIWFHKGDYTRVEFTFKRGGLVIERSGPIFACDSGDRWVHPSFTAPTRQVHISAAAENAYKAARSARFEHGEVPTL